MVPEIDLSTLDVPVNAPEGVIYSSSPRRAEGEGGHSYFVKGPEVEVAFAELVGCSFAAEVELIVPRSQFARLTKTSIAAAARFRIQSEMWLPG